MVETRHYISIILINSFTLHDYFLSSFPVLCAMAESLSSKKVPYAVVFIKGFSFIDNQKVLYLKPLNLNNFSSQI